VLQQLGGHLEVSGEVRDVKSWSEAGRGCERACRLVSGPHSESISGIFAVSRPTMHGPFDGRP